MTSMKNTRSNLPSRMENISKAQKNDCALRQTRKKHFHVDVVQTIEILFNVIVVKSYVKDQFFGGTSLCLCCGQSSLSVQVSVQLFE
ncbi:hypothetical protein M9Y10_007698 [Tritrichomonas musculus]|uniref:Uncharacterized protein n=1 Tax=Tritrichomonas musculus TaxID=1915356 RepID=A0ABR2J2W6_9EUKA